MQWFDEIFEEHTGMAAQLFPQTPLQHAQRYGQQRRVAHAPLAGQHFRSIRFIRTAALYPHPHAGGVQPRAGIPAGLPHRSRPLARESGAEHHPAGLDGAHDERHAHLQPKHSPDHGGQDARGAGARQFGQHAGHEGAGDALARRFGAQGADGGRRRVRRHGPQRRLAALGA